MSEANAERRSSKVDGKKMGWLQKAIVVGILVAVLAVAFTQSPFTSLVHPSSPAPASAPSSSCRCQEFQGVVEDCCCDYETVDSLNKDLLHPLLQKLVKTAFFRYFKVRLWCDCPFWPDDGMCQLRDCSVCECPEHEFPTAFKGLPSDDLICQEGKPQAAVDRTLDTRAFQGWTEIDNPWTNDDETDNGEMTYVNLLLNPERYTGYTGPSPRRIWEAIYKENCFTDGERDTCAERRVFYKLISGLHTSITTHIAADYLLDQAKDQWGKNPALFYERVLKYPERVQNLYFTFLFVLRAVTKAEAYLAQAEYSTGNVAEDQETQVLVTQLVTSQRLRTACPLPFDEAQLWRGADGVELKHEIQQHFRNISALMDCIGCEKCRLWGKLQILGLGTALKILFSVEGHDFSRHPLDLQRNEVIALLNLLSRLSEALELVHEMAPMVKMDSASSATTSISTGGSVLPNESESGWLQQDGDESLRSFQSLFGQFQV